MAFGTLKQRERGYWCQIFLSKPSADNQVPFEQFVYGVVSATVHAQVFVMNTMLNLAKFRQYNTEYAWVLEPTLSTTCGAEWWDTGQSRESRSLTAAPDWD